MKITIIGLGYVGCVSAACLANAGHQIVGVDISPVKTDLINKGQSPIVEKDIDELVSRSVENGSLRATTDLSDALSESDVSLICVGTPSLANGSLDLKFIRNSVTEIAHALKNRSEYHVVTIRSTMLPGTLENVVLPLLEKESGKKVGEDFGLCVNPEFLREGTAIADYRNPPFTIIGSFDDQSAEPLKTIYQDLDSPLIQVKIREAEMIKYSCNIFHALKVGFANEIGVLCKEMDIDSHKVMDIFKQDKELNISPTYLTPGFAFGGSCLPKDLRAIRHRAKTLDVDIPILDAVLPSNQNQIERAYRMVEQAESKKVGLLGLSFKAGTDDLRESPIVQLAEKLLGKGYEISIYDSNVILANLLGANKQFIQQVIPHLAKLMSTDLNSVLECSDVLVISQKTEEFRQLQSSNQTHKIIDLVRISENTTQSDNTYQGICW
ncbi:MAG: UDP-glucose/GDP-mannose dehydrogenase family protein [Acidiferrobacterales bacterium]|nr:UDP-glucose/GDP-mannose dehydrogenase family protein [Acidiferrobacterales bacterium]